MSAYRNLRVALLGAGSVGSQVARLLLEHGAEYGNRVGAGLELAGIAVRDPAAQRDVTLPQELFTTDAESLIVGADIVIELMGGIEPARSYLLTALNSGADVVTANKALLANHGPELFDAAEQVGAQLYYEAAVAAAIPIIRPLRDSLAGDRITRILGVVNGSTNFILDRMDTYGESMDQAATTARELGFLEADPTLDIEGYDAAQKATILASLAFHTTIPPESVYREGITAITQDQILWAKRSGHVIKLLAIAERLSYGATSASDALGDDSRVASADGDSGDPGLRAHPATPTAASAEGVSVRVYPALIPRSHPLGAVHGGNNAVFIDAESAGSLMFYGAGAGGRETASAVLGDVVSAARRHVVGGPGVAESTHANLPVLDIGSVLTRYSMVLEISDEPGALACVAEIISANGVSVELVEQSVPDAGEAGEPGTARLVIGTHEAREADLAATVRDLSKNSIVRSVVSVLRIEGM